jgi:hypothetical protein
LGAASGVTKGGQHPEGSSYTKPKPKPATAADNKEEPTSYLSKHTQSGVPKSGHQAK